jgi:hypothetical protein
MFHTHTHTHVVEKIKKIVPFITWKSTAQPERPQMTLYCGDGELDVLDTIGGGVQNITQCATTSPHIRFKHDFV